MYRSSLAATSGRTPPCTLALRRGRVARVVAGTRDATPHGGGADELRDRGIDVVVAEDRRARDLAEVFARAVMSGRPYVALKMAMSLDGMVSSRASTQERIGSTRGAAIRARVAVYVRCGDGWCGHPARRRSMADRAPASRSASPVLRVIVYAERSRFRSEQVIHGGGRLRKDDPARACRPPHCVFDALRG